MKSKQIWHGPYNDTNNLCNALFFLKYISWYNVARNIILNSSPFKKWNPRDAELLFPTLGIIVIIDLRSAVMEPQEQVEVVAQQARKYEYQKQSKDYSNQK